MQRRKNFTRKSTKNFKKKTAKKSHSQFRNIHPKIETNRFRRNTRFIFESKEPFKKHWIINLSAFLF